MKQTGVHRVAVFDVDGTLLRGDCLWLAARRSKSLKGQLLAVLACLMEECSTAMECHAVQTEQRSVLRTIRRTWWLVLQLLNTVCLIAEHRLDWLVLPIFHWDILRGFKSTSW